MELIEFVYFFILNMWQREGFCFPIIFKENFELFIATSPEYFITWCFGFFCNRHFAAMCCERKLQIALQQSKQTLFMSVIAVTVYKNVSAFAITFCYIHFHIFIAIYSSCFSLNLPSPLETPYNFSCLLAPWTAVIVIIKCNYIIVAIIVQL